MINRLIICMTGFVLLTGDATAGPDKRVEPGEHRRTVRVDSLQREYFVYVPKNYSPLRAAPAVLIFHGGGGNPNSMMRFTQLNSKAEETGFIAVYPAGTGRLPRRLTFNGGNCCGYAMRNDIDDVKFTNHILNDLTDWLNIDQDRIFATGMSNGAIVSYLIAAELSDRIAAIAPVGGPMGTATCNPGLPVSVIHFHGSADTFAPFEGGKGKGVSGTDFYSVQHSIQYWIKANGCDSKPDLRTIPDRANDQTSIEVYTYSNGKGGSEVVLVKIMGAGHTWPGSPSRAAFLGKSTMNISANDMMWDFFLKHPRKQTTNLLEKGPKSDRD